MYFFELGSERVNRLALNCCTLVLTLLTYQSVDMGTRMPLEEEQLMF